MADLKPIVVIPADYPAMVSRSRYLDQLREFADVRLYTDWPADEDQLLERIRPAQILLNSRSAVKVRRDVLQKMPALKMIAVCGIGYDSIDLQAASQQKVVVSNIPGKTATVVAEHAFAMMLSVARRIPDMTSAVKRAAWPDDLGVSLVGKRVGIIGTGNIGCEMIRMCRAFGMDVVAWSFHPDEAKAQELGFTYLSLDEVLQTSDVVSLHVRLSELSQHLIDATRLSKMKRGAILVNTARAAVVDTWALVDALQAQHLFGAAVDVFDKEPVVADNPLLDCRNVVLTPHSADQTQEGLDLLTMGCIENIKAFLNGAPQNVVNADLLR